MQFIIGAVIPYVNNYFGISISTPGLLSFLAEAVLELSVFYHLVVAILMLLCTKAVWKIPK